MVRFLQDHINQICEKKTMRKIMLFLIIVFLLPGCKKEYNISDSQTILFQFDYINHAWGYQHYGFIIDNEGNILKYNSPEGWNFPDNDLMINENKVYENLNKCLFADKNISTDELQKYTNYIENISSSKITALKNVAADAGTAEFICYKYSENSGTYKGYLIKMEGDFSCENLNFYSKKVVVWMKDIGNNIAYN